MSKTDDNTEGPEDEEEEFDTEIFEDTSEDSDAKIRDIIIKVIPPSEMKTSLELTITEIAELLSLRIASIEKGGQVFTDVENLEYPADMAIKELLDRKSPLCVRRLIRTVGNEQFFEEINPRDVRVRLPDISNMLFSDKKIESTVRKYAM